MWLNMEKCLLAFVSLSVLCCCCSGETSYFWHVTDFHYDYTYNNLLLSCEKDITLMIPGKFGNFWCDSPWALVNSSVQAMVNIKNDVDFILWSGDNILHADVEELSYDINAEILDNITQLFMTLFPDTPVYATLGNNDYWPDDQFPPNNNRLYNASLERWRHWIKDPTQDEHFLKGGYYSVRIQPNLRLLALNTNLYYGSNQETVNAPDPGEQFMWLKQQLHIAETNNEKVMITAHIPPGIVADRIWWQQHFHDEFVGILRRYTHVITGMHAGHHHVDTFRLLYNDNRTSSTPIFVAPSVTPWRFITPTLTGPAHNPGIRLVSFDRQTGKHYDLSQYFLDFQQANKEGKADWKLEYNTSSDYGLSDLTSRSLENLISKMKVQSGQEFKNFWKFNTVSPSDDLLETCNKDCHASVVCEFTEYSMESYKHCRSEVMQTSSAERSSSPSSEIHTSALLFLLGYLLYT